MKPYSVSEYGGYLKRKMMISRFIGIIGCLLGLACVTLYILQKFSVIEGFMNDWMLLVVLTYTMAMAFTVNSGLQGIKVGNPWQRINTLLALLFYLFVLFLIVYGFTTGDLKLQI